MISQCFKKLQNFDQSNDETKHVKQIDCLPPLLNYLAVTLIYFSSATTCLFRLMNLF